MLVDHSTGDDAGVFRLYDPQTSGGLLLVPVSETEAVHAEVEGARVIGRSLPAGPVPRP